MSGDSGWNDDALARLRALWAEALSTAEIGRRMGISKNAVVGKAHRLGLIARPSPIKRGDAQRVPQPARRVPAGARTLPPVAALPGPAMSLAIVAPTIVAPAPAPPRIMRPASVTPCCWILGDPRERRTCEAPALSGKAWCEQHHAVVYVKTRPWRATSA